MKSANTEIFKPRAISWPKIWQFGEMQFKVYELLADQQSVTDEMISLTEKLIKENALPAIEANGEHSNLGFAIIHAGSLGVTISIHWWIYGSVLCQQVYRKLYDSDKPFDTLKAPSIGCVWELEIVNFEQHAWRKSMMIDHPQQEAYLKEVPEFSTV